MVGNRIKLLRDELGLNQDELAKKIGVSPSAIGMYERDLREANDDIKLKMCDLFNCSMDYLTGKTDIRKGANPAVVLVYGTIPAGIPMEMIEDIIDTEEIDSSMLKGGKEYFGLKIKGNSMYPEYLDGDTIILEKMDDVESGSDAVVMVNGNDGTFKRVFKNENGIILQPLNPEFQPMVYTNEQIEKLPIKVIGKVVELRRKK